MCLIVIVKIIDPPCQVGNSNDKAQIDANSHGLKPVNLGVTRVTPTPPSSAPSSSQCQPYLRDV